jgi:hypothetical protein
MLQLTYERDARYHLKLSVYTFTINLDIFRIRTYRKTPHIVPRTDRTFLLKKNELS